MQSSPATKLAVLAMIPLLPLAMLPLAAANPLLMPRSGGTCTPDACLAAITNPSFSVFGAPPVSSRLADCSSFDQGQNQGGGGDGATTTTVTLSPTAQQGTVTITYTTLTTPSYWERDVAPVPNTNTNTNTNTDTQLASNTIPSYAASACQDEPSQYQSACSCAGVTVTTASAPAPEPTTTVTVTVTPNPSSDEPLSKTVVATVVYTPGVLTNCGSTFEAADPGGRQCFWRLDCETRYDEASAGGPSPYNVTTGVYANETACINACDKDYSCNSGMWGYANRECWLYTSEETVSGGNSQGGTIGWDIFLAEGCNAGD